MQNDFDEEHWNNIKSGLKEKYPILTEADLLWRNGSNKTDLLKELATRVGISWKELEIIVDNL